MKLSIPKQKDQLIRERNRLMKHILIIFFCISLLTNLIFDRNFLLNVTIPFGSVLLLLLLMINYIKVNPYVTLYSMITIMYTYIFIVIYFEPAFINFILLWLALVVSSIYYETKPIVYASLLSMLLSVYFYLKNEETIFSIGDPTDLVYIFVIFILITIFLILTSRFTEKLRKEAEQKKEKVANELFEAERFFEFLFNQMSDAVIIHDCFGKIISVNKRFQEIYSWNETEVVGSIVPYVVENKHKYLQRMWKEVYETGERIEDIEMKHVTKTGKEVHVLLSITPIHDNTGKIMALATFSRDISLKLQTEEYIRRSEKLSVVGQLAAGVAHEIRNPLTVVSGFLHLLQEQDKGNRYYRLMIKEIDRINSIINEFLIFSKPKVESYQKVHLAMLVQEVVTLMSMTAVMNNIFIKEKFFAKGIDIEADPDQMKQVLINILKNAIDAMPDGGTIYVTMDVVDEDYVMLTIVDEGVGMSSEQLARLGEPFFTSKEKGTGLGLMICYRIIENHRGKITFQSEPQVGTTVKIILPIKKGD